MTKPVLAREQKKANRMYSHPQTGEKAVSITTVMGQRDKGGGLMGWGVKAAADAAGDFLYHLANLPPEIQTYELSKYKFKKDIEPLKAAWKSARYGIKAPGSLWGPAPTGDLVHDAIENKIVTGQWGLSDTEDIQKLLREAEVSEQEALKVISPWLKQFSHWEAEFKPKWLFTEATVWSRKHGYAGTADLCAVINGKPTWLDIKSGKALYQEYSMQLHAIAKADFVLRATGEEVEMPKSEMLGLLHLTPKYHLLQEVTWEPGIYQGFLGLLQSIQAEMDTYSNWFGRQWKGAAE